jgi:hypothetical protein
MHTSYILSWLVYGLIVIASGCYRYLSRPAGEKGLSFGLAMGALAIVAAALLRSGRTRAGHVAGLCSLILVTGWFLFEALIKDGGNHELRLLLVAGLSVIQAGIAAAHLRKAPAS